MSHAARIRNNDTNPSATADENNLRLQRKEKIDRLKLQKKAALSKRASEVLRKIETAISRLDRQIAASPSHDALRQLGTNYGELEGKAKALSQLMSNPHDHVEEHSIEDHHEHEIPHDGSFEAQLHAYQGHHLEVHLIEENAKKLFQTESNHRLRSHPPGTWTSRGQEPQDNQR